MKEIKEEKKREVVDTYVYYEAIDGTRFTSEEECKKYEGSAKGVLRGKLKKLEEWRGNEWDLLKGCEDHEVIAYKLTSKEDVDTIMQAFLLDNPYYLNENDDRIEEWFAERQAMAERAYKENDLLLMGTNCDGDLYFLDTRKAFIERLNNLDKKEEKDT